MRRLSAWIAFFAILFASFGPSLAHAAAAKKAGQGWVEICSVGGSKLVKIDAASALSAPLKTPLKADTHSSHCPLCASHGTSPMLASSAATAIILPPASRSVPVLFEQSPRPLFIWTASRSRAPPAFA